MSPEPTTTEWVAVIAAGASIITVLSLHLLRPVLRPGLSAASRIAGFLLAALAGLAVVVAAVLIGAGIRASGIDPTELAEDRPDGPFSVYLFDRNPETTERVAQYGAAVLLPLTATLAVLAIAVVDAGRSIGLRAVAAVACGALLVIGALIALGDVGPLAGRAAVAVVVLAAGAAVALAVDELTHPRR